MGDAATGHGPAGASGGLAVHDLSVTYATPAGRLRAVRSVSLRVAPGEVVGLVGESGCGKSSIGRAVGGMLPASAILQGRIEVDGTDLATATAAVWDAARGRTVVWVPQGGMGALDPVRTISAQLLEQLVSVGGIDVASAKTRSRELLEQVDLPPRVLSSYPHELSGGMRQRVALSLAVAVRPKVVVADEPTTGLDADVGEQVLDLLLRRARQEGWALLVISHDLPPLKARVDRLAVMYAGRVVEDAPAPATARHPYTRALVQAVPDVDPDTPWVGIPGRPPDPRTPPDGCAYAPQCRLALDVCREIDPVLDSSPHPVACHRADETGLDLALPQLTGRADRSAGAPVLQCTGVTVQFPSRHGQVLACDAVDLTVRAGEVVALLGPSGSGKSTLARVALGLIAPDAGHVLLAGADLAVLRGRALRQARRRASLVHQDVYGALHPAMTVRRLMEEPLRLAGAPRQDRSGRIEVALGRAGLDVGLLDSLPHRLSGGQRQRVAVARALVADPVLIVADEPTSMLDAALRAEIALLLRTVADEQRGVLLITHDRGEAAKVADRVVRLREGCVEETGSATDLLAPSGHRP